MKTTDVILDRKNVLVNLRTKKQCSWTAGFSTRKRSLYKPRMALYVSPKDGKAIRCGDVLYVKKQTFFHQMPEFMKVYQVIPDFIFFEGVKGPYKATVLEFTEADALRVVEIAAKWKR